MQQRNCEAFTVRFRRRNRRRLFRSSGSELPDFLNVLGRLECERGSGHEELQ
ncbi:hypothetical protein D3C72_2496670 [compost metagenome]